MDRRTVSYAQNGEDIVLARAFPEPTGFYVDVGANDPTHDSVTKLFYDRGWVGINVEPQVTYFDALQQARPRDTALNIGVGAEPGKLDFYLVPDAKGMSSFSESHAQLVRDMGYRTERMVIEVCTLDEVFESHVGTRTVDFLKVDVEGFEDAVLDGFDWSRWRPRAMVVESSPDPSPWETRLLAHGYRRTLWDGMNLFFVREEDAETLGPKLSRPATIVLDRFDPWLYVEQVERAEARTQAALREYVACTLTDRSRRLPADDQASEDQIRAAAAAFADVLNHRHDVMNHFGMPQRIDIDGLLTWAGGVAQRSDEPHVEPLLPHAPLYRRLAGAVGGLPVTRGTSELMRLWRRVAWRR